MSLPASKKRLYYGIAIVLPFLILLAIEWALRWANYHPEPALFFPAKGMHGYLQPNEAVIQRFFAAPELAPNVSPDTQYFLAEKPADSIRIVVQGGSTAAGFPYGRWGSLSGMLQQQLKRLYPEKNIEIINTAMASVNSYTLLDFVDEIVQIEPDMVLIYAGHNEYLGIMGVGSAYGSMSSRASTLLYLKLKSLKIYRLVEQVYYAAFSSSKDSQISPGLDERTLMAQIAKDKDIPLGSAVFNQGIEQFEGNLSLILDQYQSHGIPVVLGNLVSNEEDLIPFSAIESLSETYLQELSAQPVSDLHSRQAELTRVIEQGISNNLAANYFELGKVQVRLGDYQQAQNSFQQARDLDTLRFRAPSLFNSVIQSLVQRTGVYLADVESAMRQDSKQGIIGKGHMLEHLHPTVRGYFVLSRAFLDSMVEHKLLPKSAWDNVDRQWLAQPVSEVDAAYGEFKVRTLTADYPFTAEPIEVSVPTDNSITSQYAIARIKGESWLALNQSLVETYQKQGNFSQAALIAGLLADALPNQGQLTYVAGMLYKRLGDLPLSIHHLKRAIDINPENVPAYLSVAQNWFEMGQYQQSLTWLQKAKERQPDHPQIDQFIVLVKSKL